MTTTNDYTWTDDEGRPKSEALPPGPWQGEPDKIVWIDPSTDLDCMIIRGPVGALCGYVAVPPGHPCHGKGYDDVDVRVHGGLTYANECGGHICHVPQEGRPDDVWWLGFDCAHALDLTPALIRFHEMHGIDNPFKNDVYRDVEYVTNEVTQLAAQLKELT